ncbi:hypothetical protein [Actinokineospora globicatena]|uniref:hypothetical protein n=1 Tax=Actinokineospora globicatena TaxID=103729 RepID=UPI0020A61147|nr:hypothetical protein [Actinokineospora globicatena]MCP2302789.1 hypothetical protein [Actinokineospora globicatena]GLW75520.1 hypothetical protein Aglo01_00020 [Actinokineospora globicatena]GLW82361.1 hypothetical protein Aglo02_00020 [Actinokineospora globicatena]
MDADARIAVLGEELRAVRKGLGLYQTTLPAVAGPVLLDIAGATATDPPGTVRDKLVATVRGLITRLPEGRQELARAVFGLDNPGNTGYMERLVEQGRTADRDLRTMQRRANEVVYLLAELACVYTPAAAASVDTVPWHTKRLDVRLVLRGDDVEVFETRRVVSHEPDLVDVAHSISVGQSGQARGPVDLAALGIDEISGGEVRSPRMVSADRVAFTLRPPAPLGPGDEHDFFFRIRATDIAPFYCCTPEFDCERFSLNIRFEPHRRPTRVWRINGEFSKEAADPTPTRATLQVDDTGEVRTDFTNLRPARSYGIGWAL